MSIQSVSENTSLAVGASHDSRWKRIASTLLTEHWLIRIGLVLIFGLYLRTIGFAPVYDDNSISPWGSFRDIPKLFAHDIFGFDGQAHSVYYRPLSGTWGLLVGLISGGAPGWMHLSAIFLHILVIVLAYKFGCYLFDDNRLALLTALLFGLHPSKVESVAWIGSSCVDGLSAVFLFGSLIAFLKHREGGHSRLWLSSSVFLFACAMFTKETMVLIPILIASYIWLLTPREGRGSRTSWTLLPYTAVWAVYMAIRHQIIKPPAVTAEYVHPTFTLTNLWTAPYSIWWYIGHLIMPWRLSVEYEGKTLEHPTLREFVLPGLGLLLLLAIAAWLWNRQRSRRAAFLMIWFAMALAPAVVVAPMVKEHDRYLYISSYAFCALIAWMVLRLGTLPARLRLTIAFSIVFLWSGLTWHETGYWDCDATLWSRVLEISPSHVTARIQRAYIYRNSGDLAKALSLLEEGLRYRPDSPNIWLARADILTSNKQFDAARSCFLKVMGLIESPAVRVGDKKRLGSAAAHELAKLDIADKNFVEAERYARRALELDSDGAGYHYILSESLRGQGRTEEAKAESSLELRLRLAQHSKGQTQGHP